MLIQDGTDKSWILLVMLLHENNSCVPWNP